MAIFIDLAEGLPPVNGDASRIMGLVVEANLCHIDYAIVINQLSKGSRIDGCIDDGRR